MLLTLLTLACTQGLFANSPLTQSSEEKEKPNSDLFKTINSSVKFTTYGAIVCAMFYPKFFVKIPNAGQTSIKTPGQILFVTALIRAAIEGYQITPTLRKLLGTGK